MFFNSFLKLLWKRFWTTFLDFEKIPEIEDGGPKLPSINTMTQIKRYVTSSSHDEDDKGDSFNR